MAPTQTAPLARPVTADDVGRLGDVLAVWAHPDDESYLSGGLLRTLAERGARVACVTATWGEAGTAEGAGRRRAELQAALGVLGVRAHVALGYPDGRCSSVEPGEAADRLARILADWLPDTVVTFGPDGHTGHPDHRAVSEWVRLATAGVSGVRVLHAAAPAGASRLFGDIHDRFSVFDPGLPVEVSDGELAMRAELDGDVLDAKIRALRAHASQTTAIIDGIGLTRFRAWVATECFREAPTSL